MPAYPVTPLKRKPIASVMPTQLSAHKNPWGVITVCIIVALVLIFGIRAIVVKRNQKFNTWYETRNEQSKTEIFQRLDASDRTMTATDRANMFKALGSADATLYDADRAALYVEVNQGEQDARSDARKEWRRRNE